MMQTIIIRGDMTGPSSQHTVRFVAMGDWGKPTLLQKRIAALLNSWQERHRADAVLALGDNFYEYGVGSTTDPLWRSVFLDVYQPRIPWFPVLGNHDYVREAGAQIEFSRCHPLWRFPNRYYDQKFFWGSGVAEAVHLIAIDTFDLAPLESQKMASHMDVTGTIATLDTRTQLEWLENTLRDSPCRQKIVMGHYPVFSAGYVHGDCPELVRILPPLFETYGVAVYISGHEHCLDLQTIRGTSYIISGCGSMSSGNRRADRLSTEPGLCHITASGDGLLIRFISPDHECLLEHTIRI